MMHEMGTGGKRRRGTSNSVRASSRGYRIGESSREGLGRGGREGGGRGIGRSTKYSTRRSVSCRCRPTFVPIVVPKV